ncbi:MAG: MBL fold metallo-hydrolase [Chloroflexi bacterium RBG_16_54_11]|nr:MAG: MBL fold metallo-hydrolase [Chloroflexi bacterium RBG_16_54_11]
MPEAAPLTIVNVGYLSTNYWVISAGRRRLLVDLGYPGTMGKMRARLKQMDIPLTEMRYALATHYHIDHAGLGQELKMAGVPLLVMETQVAAIPLMNQFTKPHDHYVEVTLEGNKVISCAESREVLGRIGIPGEIISTPGHSDDSVSLLLDDGSSFTGDLTPMIGAGGEAGFTGDLTPLEAAWGEAGEVVKASWRLLWELGARTVYPAHGPVRAISVD